ncbi:flagellar basal body rod protein FlgB [Ralstonia sp. 24A2]|uniref:flagellar basal body rod protein FlgB n=1 Tax=Ralstonia sp. 24A2 TaxID=3447364 RepID=UPI003F6A2D1F
MNSGIEGVTTAALSLALDAASLQHRVLAANVANANTPGYVPMRLQFSAQIDEMAARRASVSADPASMFAVRMSLQPAQDASGAMTSVQPDQEMAAMSANALQYQALATALDRHFSVLLSAVSDGKR